MITNKILTRLKSGQKALGFSMTCPSEESVEICARLGLDFVSFDGQHSAITPETVEGLCRVADGFGITPMMRVPDQEESTLLRFLDRGIKAVVIPNLQTKKQAETLVRHCKFVPEGMRSATSVRVVLNVRDGDYKSLTAEINANTMIIPQLESITAFNNLDEILTVPGIDFFSGGPWDVAQSMGYSPGEENNLEIIKATKDARAKVNASGKQFFDQISETVEVMDLLVNAGTELLERHGRKPGIVL